MKAYVTSVGEKTEALCVDQLNKMGFQTCILGGKEPWHRKYIKFLELARKFDEDCVRVDADVLVNKQFTPESVKADLEVWKDALMLQYTIFDFYRNSPHIGQPVVYRAGAIQEIIKDVGKIDLHRPETSAWRLPHINPRTGTIDRVVGMHGFFQTPVDVARAKEHKIERKQMDKCDFDLVNKVMAL